ncbi:MAG: hypothetical protein PHV13_02285 [Candidatus ainarchaeum sp.]|nr:hypothetical protein [Candidatus ainarchaeum sp.]
MDWKGIRFYKVEAESSRDENFTSVAVNLDVTGMKPSGGDLRIDFSYSVNYQPGVARLRFDGYTIIGASKAELDRIEKDWKKDKTLPKSLAEPLINVISFNAETNGVLIAKAINIVPPLLAPKIEIGAPKK